MNRAILVAIAFVIGSCGSSFTCSNSVKMQLNYVGAAVNATDLTIGVSVGAMETYVRARKAGRTTDTIEIKVPTGTGEFTVTVIKATADDVTLGVGSAPATVKTMCPNPYEPYQITIAPSSTSTPPGDGGTPTCTKDCSGSGTCTGKCDASTGNCDYSGSDQTSCDTCVGGLAYTNSTCSDGACTLNLQSTACANSICGDVSCASPQPGPGQIVAGIGFSCVSLGPGNNVRCWGSNKYGVLGTNVTTGGTSAVPVAVPNTTGITSLVAGDDHVCGVRANDMICWGRNQSGQLGILKDDVAHPTPVTVPGIVPLMAAASSDHTCAIVQNAGEQTQTVNCWGMNYAGELGEGSGIVISVSPVSPFLEGSYQSLALGDKHLCVADKASSGSTQTEVTCIGDDTSSQLGNDALTGLGVVSLPFANVQLSAGGNTTCAFDGGDTPASLYCWGDNSSGQLGVGSSATSSGAPVSVCNNNFINMVDCDIIGSVSVGRGYACGGFSNGISCWGSYADGQLGQLAPAGSSNSTIPVPTLDSGTFVAAGGGHACAIALAFGTASSLTVDCWGDNRLGQTGDPIQGHLLDGLLPAAIFWAYE